MAIELFKRELSQLIKSISGLLAVLIIDRDGVPLIEVHKDLAPELAMQATALSITVLAVDQVSKLGFVTLIADSSANTGMLLAMGQDFDPVLQELRKIKF